MLRGELPLLPSQKHFFYNMNTNRAPISFYNAYVVSYLIEMENIDEEVLMESLIKLVERHDAFRLCYQRDTDGAIHQYYSENLPEIKLYKQDAGNLETKKILSEWTEKIDIFSGPLFLFGYITGFDKGKAQLYLLSHHLNTDGVSWRIVGNDFETMYAYLKAHKNDMKKISAGDILGAKGTSCRQWIQALADYGKAEEENRHYWEDILRSTQKSNERIHSVSLYDTRENHIIVSKELTSRILKASHRGLETRIDDILLSALNMALNAVVNIENPCILMETHGRQEIGEDIDISRTMGWFASSYPVRLPQCNGLKEVIKNTKEMLRMVPNEGIGANALWMNQDNLKDLLPTIYFNYQGEYESGLDIHIELKETETMGVVDVNGFDISINAHVTKQQFEFIVLSKLSDENTLKFKNELKKSLDAVITVFENERDI
jgi:hypothetical protein